MRQLEQNIADDHFLIIETLQYLIYGEKMSSGTLSREDVRNHVRLVEIFHSSQSKNALSRENAVMT